MKEGLVGGKDCGQVREMELGKQTGWETCPLHLENKTISDPTTIDE